jgi:hypothetical protein
MPLLVGHISAFGIEFWTTLTDHHLRPTIALKRFQWAASLTIACTLLADLVCGYFLAIGRLLAAHAPIKDLQQLDLKGL